MVRISVFATHTKYTHGESSVYNARDAGRKSLFAQQPQQSDQMVSSVSGITHSRASSHTNLPYPSPETNSAGSSAPFASWFTATVPVTPLQSKSGAKNNNSSEKEHDHAV
jgi:hypothetical protein